MSGLNVDASLNARNCWNLSRELLAVTVMNDSSRLNIVISVIKFGNPV